MKAGAKLVGTSDEDMIEFLNWIRGRGGQCVCTDFEGKIIEVVRGTRNEEKTLLFNIDGVLGAVDPGDADPGGEQAEQT